MLELNHYQNAHSPTNTMKLGFVVSLYRSCVGLVRIGDGDLSVSLSTLQTPTVYRLHARPKHATPFFPLLQSHLNPTSIIQPLILPTANSPVRPASCNYLGSWLTSYPESLFPILIGGVIDDPKPRLSSYARGQNQSHDRIFDSVIRRAAIR